MIVIIQSKSFRLIILISLVIAFITGYVRGEERYFFVDFKHPKREISQQIYKELSINDSEYLKTYFEYNYRDAIVVFIALTLLFSLLFADKNFSSASFSESETLKNKTKNNFTIHNFLRKLKYVFYNLSSIKKFVIFSLALILLGCINYFPFSTYYYCVEKNLSGRCIDKIPISTLVIVIYSIVWAIAATIYAFIIFKVNKKAQLR